MLPPLPERAIVDSGYYAACAGLRARTQALELISNNLANLNTAGFRAQDATFRSLLAGSSRAGASALNRVINDFGVLGGSRVDLRSGSMESTGNPLDMALEGEGFFAVQTHEQTLYTRNGSFRLSPSRQLITSEGDPVLGEQGPIVIPSGQVSVGTDGTISVDGAVAGKLRLVSFARGTSLRAVGNTYFEAPHDAATLPAANVAMRQGMLEGSNVNPVSSVVNLITVQREAEMLQRALSTYYSEFDHIAASDLPRV
jgi:flagellar basal-body rod protein FlgF/flagellar basal-body rod protein FlgG